MQRDHLNEFDPTAPIAEQASFWWVLLNEGEASPADHRAFGEWVTRSPERVAAYLQAARLTSALQSTQIRWPDTPVEEVIRAARSAPTDVVSFPNSGSRSERATSASTMRWGLIAIVALVVLGIGLYLYLPQGPQHLATAVGEQRSVVLADGSLVTLNTSSSIEVQMAKDHRVVRLLAGEALFVVAHDVARPFDVTTGDTTVRAVGTQFNVERRAGSTTVTVLEGRVAVFTTPAADQQKVGQTQLLLQQLPLEAGEQLTVAARIVRHPVHADVATTIAWTQRKLIFEHRPLGEVAAEFNRYNQQVIEIRSPELRNQEVTGVFQANDPVSFLAFLSGLPGVSVAQAPDHSRFIVTQEAQNTTQ